MLAQVLAAEFELERITADLIRHAASASLEPQRHQLTLLKHQIAGAGPATLTALRHEIGAAVAQTQTATQQARLAGTGAEAAEIATLAEAAKATRRHVDSFLHDFYERKIFDPYLRFASVEDEEAYRKREEAYRKAIDAAMAKGTPEGDLEALALANRQLRDAGAHGASAAPEFAGTLARNQAQYEKLRTAVLASGGQVAPADKIMNASPDAPEPEAPQSKSHDAELASAMAALRAAGAVPCESTSSQPVSMALDDARQRTRQPL